MHLDFNGSSEHPILSAKPKLLFVGDAQSAEGQLADQLRQSFEVVPVQNPLRALGRLRANRSAACMSRPSTWAMPSRSASCCRTSAFSRACPTGSSCSTARTRSSGATAGCASGPKRESVIGSNFYTVLGSPEILGPDFCPFHTALATGQPSNSTLRSGDNRYFQVHAAPVFDENLAAAAPDRHGPRRHERNAPAAEAGRDPPGRRRTGRPDARRAVA